MNKTTDEQMARTELATVQRTIKNLRALDVRTFAQVDALNSAIIRRNHLVRDISDAMQRDAAAVK